MTDDLKEFKISDQRKPGLKQPQKQQDAAPPPSVGFPRIEALVEAEEPNIDGFGERHNALDELMQHGSAKEKGAAKKAKVAYERAQDVIEYLLETKKQMNNSSS